MATPDGKENIAPLASSDPLQRKSSSPAKKAARKGRSKSIGPGGLDEGEAEKKEAKQDAKNRRKSAYVPSTKSIISTDIEKAERQAARRKTLANRRVSFAPEATLHTWDIVEHMRDQTTSTDSSDETRRTSKAGSALDSDPPSTPPEQADEDDEEGDEQQPEHQRDLHQKKRRRSSGIPPMNFNNPEDAFSSSPAGGSSGMEESESEDGISDDETGTAMSLDMGEITAQSMGESDSSTSSSARLEANLRMAAQQAGTRGIEYDEYGEESMELAGDTVTNAFKPFAGQQAQDDPMGSASMDQENVNPFSPAFKAQLVSGTVNRPNTVQEEDTEEMTMDMTRAVGGVMQQPEEDSTTSSSGDGTMDITQAVGQIKGNSNAQGQKRRRSTTEAGSPGAASTTAQSKRRRSSVARSSMGDDTMDLTMAIGGIKGSASPAKPQRRRVSTRRRSSGVASIASEQDDATMDLTRAVGGVKAGDQTNHTTSSYDENEELSMDLTAVLGGVKAADKARPATPRQSQSPVKDQANTTPKDQERFKDAPDSGARKALTPLLQKQTIHSAEKKSSSGKKATFGARNGPSPSSARSSHSEDDRVDSVDDLKTAVTPKGSPLKVAAPQSSKRASLGGHKSPLRATPTKAASPHRAATTPDSEAKRLLDAQLETTEPSPIVAKQLRSSPAKSAPATPEQPQVEPTQDGRRLADSIKLMSTPRKDALKNVTPKKQTPAAPTPAAAPASRLRPTPRSNKATKTQPPIQSSPAKQLVEDVNRIESGEEALEKVKLQEFLDLAGIRFMDLTTTKRRMTTAITPSKARKEGQLQQEPEVNFESAIVAGGCTLPELEMYEHACHELKRYISDGKKVIKELEASTAREAPPLIKAYMAANYGRRSVLDSQMRDIKTQARLRSKEMWYAWRSQLLEDLMKALQGIGEGLISDDEALSNAEHILEQAVPGLVEKREALQQEKQKLEEEASSTNEGEKEELEATRERVQEVSSELEEKRALLQRLQTQAKEQEETANDLEEQKAEFTAAIKEAERVTDACRGVSINEITTLKESITTLEQDYGWTITSASSTPPTITMTYRSQLQLFFHPPAFLQPNNHRNSDRPNAPISLVYLPSKPLTTTLRFFLQLLRASLQALPQSSTRVQDLLHLVSRGWDTAQTVAETERKLTLEGMTETRIISDESLSIASLILLPAVRTKVHVTFDVSAAVGADEDEGLELSTTVGCGVKVVYGEPYNEKKMGEFVGKELGGGVEGWEGVVRGLRERLVARGKKGGEEK